MNALKPFWNVLGWSPTVTALRCPERGERRRVELARTFASKARLMLVDEPFAALDPKTVSEVSKHIEATASTGVGVLVTDHYVAQTLDLCHRIYILKDGHVLSSGSAEAVAGDPKVRDSYLGADYSR